MPTNAKSRSLSRRTGVVLLLVGVLAGVTVGGGVGVIAASSTKTVTVCANRKTNVLRYAKNGKCVKKTERKVVLNQTGVAGTAGATGAKGDTGAAGTSSPTGFTARSVCGANGTTLCEVGVQGPGGGTIVYVDLTNEMPGYDYLEVAPSDALSDDDAFSHRWARTTAFCGSTASVDCQSSYLIDAGNALKYVGLGTGRAATAAIVAVHNADDVEKKMYAAGAADTYTTATASDWFLPSRDELNEVCKYARNTGQAAGAGTVCSGGTLRSGFASEPYWSSSENEPDKAWGQYFLNGEPGSDLKSRAYRVRPVRAF